MVEHFGKHPPAIVVLYPGVTATVRASGASEARVWLLGNDPTRPGLRLGADQVVAADQSITVGPHDAKARYAIDAFAGYVSYDTSDGGHGNVIHPAYFRQG